MRKIISFMDHGMERNEEIKRNVVKPIICSCSVAHSFGLCKVQANFDFSLEEGSLGTECLAT